MFYLIKIFSFLLIISSITKILNCIEIVLKLNNIYNKTQAISSISNHYNLIYKGVIFNDYLIFESKHDERFKRSLINDNKSYLFYKLKKDQLIRWFEIQKYLKRVKRDFIFYDKQHDDQKHDENYLKEEEIIYHSYHPIKYNRAKYIYLLDEKQNKEHQNIKCEQSSYDFNDPEWINQWYINDGCEQGYSLNVTKAWRMGYTGRGVVVSIIDDGVEKDNLDLIDNFDLLASYDLNDNDTDPQPRYDSTNENKHGTRCAGEIAAKSNNSFCGIGVAFNTKIGGIRLLDGKITDRLEAEALNFNFNYIDIFSASWGPLDDGKTVDGPGLLSKQAFKNGISYGRNGKGAIYVWAAGNGGRMDDNCNCDGYTSSIYTITIGSVNQDGEMPVYSEKCSAILASTFSSGKVHQGGVITSDLHNSCTKRHTGTSASAPIGAGIIALSLEANSNLTWRDIQYLIIHSSDPHKLRAKDWQRNGIGKYISHNYGYGLMNAGKMVESALNWTLIGKQLNCTLNFLSLQNFFGTEYEPGEGYLIKGKSYKIFSLNYNLNHDLDDLNRLNCDSRLNYLEHVISTITLVSGIRGKIKINLISPSNTKSNLLSFRNKDKSRKGFKSWPFMSVHYWGENPNGTWYLEIINKSDEDIYLKEWSLIFYGAEKLPNIFLKNF